MLKILQNIDFLKATQPRDVPVRIMKENKSTFSNILTLTITLFLMDLRRLTLILFIRKMVKLTNNLNTFERCSYDQIYECIDAYYQKFNVASEKVSVRNIY